MECPGRGEVGAIHLAAMAGNSAIVQELTAHGADARRGIWPHRDATSAIQLARDRGFEELMSIMQAPPVNANQTEASTDLFQVLANLDEERAIDILESDPTLALIEDDDGWPLMHRAAQVGADKLIAHLLSLGVDPAATVEGVNTADFAAISSSKDFSKVPAVIQAHGVPLGNVSLVALGDLDAIRQRHAAGELQVPTRFELFKPFPGLLPSQCAITSLRCSNSFWRVD